MATALRERRLAWWMVLGGLAGAWFVITQGLSAGVVGVALFTVAIVAGQTLGGIVFDLVGLGPGGRRPLTPTRVIGAVLALAAIGWAVSAQVAHDVPILLMVLPFVAGLGAAWQQAVNGRVRSAAESALTATVLNFAVGSTALVVVMLVHAASAGWPSAMPTEWWLYAGGAIGCIFIAGQAVLVRVVGVLVLALCGVAGQLTAALSLDLLLPTADAAGRRRDDRRHRAGARRRGHRQRRVDPAPARRSAGAAHGVGAADHGVRAGRRRVAADGPGHVPAEEPRRRAGRADGLSRAWSAAVAATWSVRRSARRPPGRPPT